MLTNTLKAQHDVSTTTGQGDAVFSWDQGLTASCHPLAPRSFNTHSCSPSHATHAVARAHAPGRACPLYLCAHVPGARRVLPARPLPSIAAPATTHRVHPAPFNSSEVAPDELPASCQ